MTDTRPGPSLVAAAERTLTWWSLVITRVLRVLRISI
jgi:hypothetical protein